MSKTTEFLVSEIVQRDEVIRELMLLRRQIWSDGWVGHRVEMERQEADPSHPITDTNPHEYESGPYIFAGTREDKSDDK